MTLAQALAQARARGIARLDAQLLLLHVLGRPGHDRAWLIAHDTDALDADAAARFDALCERRAGGEPVAYLVGRKEFHRLQLAVDARVLVPRPDTETLVEWALEVLAALDAPAADVIDLGTGSGAIALAIRHACPAARVEAVDVSPDALAVARANGEALGLPVLFRQADWLQGAGTYDLIVSNPPYVREDDEHLDALRHEPRGALVAGTDGLADIRRIVHDAPDHLRTGGWLLMEHGHDQADAVRALLRDAGFTGVASRRDLAGIERCTGGRRPERG